LFHVRDALAPGSCWGGRIVHAAASHEK
jgi:hypothetical protein